MIDFDTFKKLPKNVRELGKLIAAKDFKKWPKVQKIAQSGHTGRRHLFTTSGVTRYGEISPLWQKCKSLRAF